MPTYFRKTIKLLPWVTLNLNKSGASLSIGPKGAKLNISKKGVYFNSNIRGTGVYNKTKVGSSLLWALFTLVAMVAAGYGLGIWLQNFNLFVGMCIASIPAAIAAFLISKHFNKTTTEVLDEEEMEDLSPTRRSSQKKTISKRTASTRRTATKTGSSRTSTGTTRTSNASAKTYISEVEALMDKMAEAETMEALNKAHNEILDIMYTDIKPLQVKVFGMEFDEAMASIEQDYAEGVRQLSGGGQA